MSVGRPPGCARGQVGSAGVRPDVEFLKRRRFTGRTDGPLGVIQLEGIERALTRLQMKIAKSAEGATEFEPVVGIAGVSDPLEDLDPAGVEGIGPAWRGA